MDIELIKSITQGAVRIEESEKGISFFRFTKEQEDMYEERLLNFYLISFSNAGVKLCFETDSESLFVKFLVEDCNGRPYFSIDIEIDGKIAEYIDNFSVRTDNLGGIGSVEIEKNLHLGKGNKKVCVYLPWSAKVCLQDLKLDSGAKVLPIKRAKKMLVFGDSITHGYDCARPSNHYIERLAKELNAEVFNKAIGGEMFWLELAETDEDFVPDYVSVAYGTNDWTKKDRATFESDCESFYKTLSKKYPNSKIFAITPIWRADKDKQTRCGDFDSVKEYIKKVATNLENVIYINGRHFLPEDTTLYADLFLHPNDEGFDYYFNNLYKEIKKYI